MEATRQGLRPRSLTPSKPPKPSPSTNAERCKKYKQKIREDPLAYEDWKKTKREYNKTYHAKKQLDDEAKERRKEQNRKNQQRRRERLKNEAAREKTSTPKKQVATNTRVKTREQMAKDAEKRHNATLRQRKRRANMHPQKRRRENEKRMERYYQNKPVRTSSSALDKKKVTTIASLLKGAFRTLKKGRDKLTLFKLQFVKKLLARQPTDDQRKTAAYYQRKKPTYSTAAETFFENVSVDFPGQRGSSKPKKVLTKTMLDLFQDFKNSHPNSHISFTTFKRKRPEHVLLSGNRKFMQCLCERCTNVMLMMDVVNPSLKKKDVGDLNEKVTNVDELIMKTLCANVTRSCVDRQCDSCGIYGLITSFRNELSVNLLEEKEWKRWEKSDKCRKDLVTKTTTVDKMLLQMTEDLGGLAKHLKTAHWQRKQYQKLCTDIPPGHAVLTVDFAENYLCKFQNEVQSAHWSYRQVSLHPCVFHYRCGKSGCYKVILDFVIFMSNDLKHDSFFANTVLEHCISYAQGQGISCVHIFSDGCAAQYKSRYAFNHLNKLQEKYKHMKLTRHFFGSNHGKSLCDSSGGTIKNAAARAVLSGEQVIQSAEDLYDFCVKKLSVPDNDDCSHLRGKRSFLLIKSEDIERPSVPPKLKAISGTQEIHCLLPLLRGSLKIKHLSCFCEFCLIGTGSSCDNAEFTMRWKHVSLHRNPKRQTESLSSTTNTTIDVLDEESNQNEEHVMGASFSSPELPLSVSREEFFASMQNVFTSCENFSILRKVVQQASSSLDRFPLPVIIPRCIIESGQSKIDAIARKLVPSGLSLHPLLILSDGNCVPRSLSILCFGDEEHHRELRCRIACELVLNSHDYLSLEPSVLNFLCQHADTLCHDAQTTFEVETVKICKDGIFMGIWQLMAAANVLGAEIFSVYPDMGPQKYREFYTRTFRPRSVMYRHILTLMWSATSEHNMSMPLEYWTANHVVPLLSLSTPYEVSVDLN